MAVAQETDPKMGCPGKWKHGPKPAVCLCLILNHTQMLREGKAKGKANDLSWFGCLSEAQSNSAFVGILVDAFNGILVDARALKCP